MADYIAKNPQYKSGYDLLGTTKAEPPIVAWNVIRPLITKALNDVLDGKAVGETFAKLQDDSTSALDANKPGAPLPTPIPTAIPTQQATAAATAPK